MDDDSKFWTMVEDSWRHGQRSARPGFFARLFRRSAPDSDQIEAAAAESLKSALMTLPAAEIVAFKKRLEAQLDRAYKANVWEAAYVLMGGCSDDMFEYFRAWLIAQGRETFEGVLADPESLADVETGEPDVACQFEALLYVPVEAYEESGFGDLYADLPARDTSPELDRELHAEEKLPALYPRIESRWQRKRG